MKKIEKVMLWRHFFSQVGCWDHCSGLGM